MNEFENLKGLTNAQLALIIAEKVTGTISQGAKKDGSVIYSAEIFYKWLKEKDKEINNNVLTKD